MLKILGRLYSNDSFSLQLGAYSTDTRFKVTTGVHEGSPLSPLLFILFVAGLVDHLRATGSADGGIRLSDGSRIFCVMYADDVLLIATTEAGLQRLIDDTTQFFRQNGMSVNPDKSDVVIFSRSDRVYDKQISINDVPKDVGDEAKYLGVMFERNGSWKLQKEATSTRCRSALGRCKVICKSPRLTNTDTMIQIFDMFSSAIFRYSAGAWGPLAGDLSCIDKVFADFIGNRFMLTRTTSLEGLLMQFGKRCAACDSMFLAAVQVARGLANTSSIWGRILTNTMNDARVRWIRNVSGRLEEMGLTNEVIRNPVQFLERRKEYGVVFSQYCHHFHLTFANGTLADFFRVDRPFGVLPFLAQLPCHRARFPLLFVLSCWRWSIENGPVFPEYCPECGDRITSEHLLFRCVLTGNFRRQFESVTGASFTPESLLDSNVVDAFSVLCEDIVNLIRTFPVQS